jgi:hypothetical protein
MPGIEDDAELLLLRAISFKFKKWYEENGKKGFAQEDLSRAAYYQGYVDGMVIAKKVISGQGKLDHGA